MRLDIEGLTREQELAWLMALPWTFTSAPADDPGEFVVRVAEMPDALAVGDEQSVSREIVASLRASLEVRLDHDDPIPLPRAHVVRAEPIVCVALPAPSGVR